MFKIFINKNFKIKNYIKSLIKISLFKNFFLIFKFYKIFKIYKLNKFYKKKFFICDMLTFNFFNKKTFVFLNYNLILINSKKNKIKFFLFFIYNLLHCILHSQKFNHKNFKKFKIMNFFHNKIMKKYGFFLKCRL